MYCRKCGAENDDNSYKCVTCGEVLHEVIGNAPVRHIPNYLVQSILVTVFCCLPLGIPGIVYASQVNARIQAGDVAGAVAASTRAKMWSWWAFGVGLAVTGVWILATAMAGFSG